MGKKIFISTIMTLVIFLASLIPVEAAGASANITASSTKVVVGNTVTFTVKVNSSIGITCLNYTTSYDSSKISLTSGSSSLADCWNTDSKSKTFTFKFKAKSAGKATFKINGYVSDSNTKYNFSAEKTITIITQKEYEASKSSNNYLSSLSVEGATLTPSFNKNTTSYTVELPANTERINIRGAKADSRASVTGLGTHAVEDGKNTIKVSVVAENGSERVYTITANVKELDPIKVTVNDTEYTIVRKAKLLKTPNNTFTDTEIEYKDTTIPGFINDKAKLTLVGLKDSEGNINLYIYKDDKFTLYNEYSFNTLNIYIEDKEINSYLNKEEIDLNDNKVTVYKLDNTDYYYFYGINLDTGEETIYRYDKQDNTVQRYLKEEEQVVEEKKEDTNLLKVIIVALLGFIFLTYLVLLVIILSKGKKNNKEEKETKKKIDIEEGEVEVPKIEEETEEMANILEDTVKIKKTSTKKKKSTKKKGD